MQLENFFLLEERLRELVRITKDLIEEREKITSSLRQKDLQIEEMKKELEDLRIERGNIRKEIEEIIEKIESVL